MSGSLVPLILSQLTMSGSLIPLILSLSTSLRALRYGGPP
jgi:hypothetical protein